MALAAGEMRDMLTSYLPAFFAAGLLCLVAVPPLTLLGEQTGMRLWHILHLKRQT